MRAKLARTPKALSHGMQAFQISAAKHINAAVSGAGSWWERRRSDAPRPKRRKGRVFADRYHARIVTSPLRARRELAYVLKPPTYEPNLTPRSRLSGRT